MTIRPFSDNELMEISKILGETYGGFTGSEIATLLTACGFQDPGGITKRDRLFLGLQDGQTRDKSGSRVGKLIQLALDPVRYRENRDLFEYRRHELNLILAFAGIQIRDDGKLEAVPAATTLTEAQQRASKLRSELVRRAIAADVSRFCRPELLEGNYFHAVFEATKSVAQKLRDRTGLTVDGHALVDQALGIEDNRTPLLAWNSLTTENDRSEHRGVVLMMKGTFSYFRNLPAHVPKVGFRIVTEEEALELLTIVSFLHRRLDVAVTTSPARLA
ncbi:MAG: TIGR02391 family protein [Chloroflexota bacterium]